MILCPNYLQKFTFVLAERKKYGAKGMWSLTRGVCLESLKYSNLTERRKLVIMESDHLREVVVQQSVRLGSGITIEWLILIASKQKYESSKF